MQGLSPTSGPSDVPTLQLGIGSLAAGYFIKERRKATTGKPDHPPRRGNLRALPQNMHGM